MKYIATDEVIIDRINGGIPLIKVKNESDKYHGLGYCHALDRGMQLILMKILGTGTASEHLAASDEMLEIDKFFRRMNWNNNIAAELEKLDVTENDLLQAYCDGINAAFATKKPWEFKTLLGYTDFHWTKQDTILLSRMSGYLTLAQSQGEIERLCMQMIQQGVNKNLLNELFPDILGSYDESILKQVRLGDKIVPDAVKWNVANPTFMASNNWVVSGSRTFSGSAMFANDPHLEINRLPAVWYEAAVQLNTEYTHGATMPGLPSFIIGRNNNVAWGVTYAFMDAYDSWIEKCKDGKYLKDDKWYNFTERNETISRKKKAPVTITFYENEHGVLDGDPYSEGFYLCSKWSGGKSGAQTLKSGFNLGNAKTVKAGMEIAGKIESAFSWIFADTNGNIGFQMSGLMPERKEGNSGFVALPGWLSENDWQGFHAPEDLPQVYNPEEGIIITANNNLNHHGKVAPSNMPMGAYRAERIEQLIKAKSKLEVADFQKMQYDTYSLQAKQFMEIIRPLLPDSEAGNILKEWDLGYNTNSKGAFLFEMIYRSLLNEVFGNALGKSLVEFLQNETGLFIDFYQNFDRILLSEKSAWFFDKKRVEIYQNAIDTGLKTEIKKWGEVNQITLSHIVLGGKFPKFFGFDKGPFQLPGGRATVHQGQIYKSAGRKTSFAPSFRLVSDMAERKLYTNYAGGVSDRIFSKWYNNDFSNWMNGGYKKFEF
ncbi:MAG: penicillin acylase family protein [Lentimicrobiaceae bacterium]|jgi:penicillin amidase